ncbi:DNA mismatch repair protein PMS1-like isoform X2 [Zingiber officinale]|uniref:DNA mismatch repair protein PMS1-like isoform X2 n=1 Tax=Zingiber officinale TaxID=94328 RepID=UPI001C4C0DF7|nr:DNA mismatch repair protein PMS1-like isoform X2 [Zingiber officinale]
MEKEDVPHLIKPISQEVVHRISSGQVILELRSAVKELLENSLDAGATSIEINLKEYGKECFKVVDNGYGISPENFQVVALKHHTSKISIFSDLHCLTTFGFRGEALNSLCMLGDLTVETRTKNEALGTHLVFDHSGFLTNEKKIARQVGTTVIVEKLFSTLPVRCKEFTRNIRREFGKLISLLNAYALIAKGVRLLCTNTTDCKVEGFLSKPQNGSGRTTAYKHYFFVNGRPVDMPKVSKLVNELFRSSSSKQFPIVILNFTIPATSYDVNVTPDKRKIFYSDEGALMLSLRAEIEKIYLSRGFSFAVNRIEVLENEKCDASGEEGPLASSKGLSCEHGDQELSECDPPKNVQVKELNKERIFLCEKRSMPKELDSRSHEIDESVTPLYHPKQLNDFHKISSKIDAKRRNCAKLARNDKTACLGLIQSSLTNFLSPNKRKHEDSCNVLSETPLLRNRSCQVRKCSFGNQTIMSEYSESDQCIGDGSPKSSEKVLLEDQSPPVPFDREKISFPGECRFRDRGSIEDMHTSADVTMSSYKDLKMKAESISSPIATESFDERYDTRKPCSDSKTCSVMQFSMDDLRRKTQFKFTKLPQWKTLHGRIRKTRCYTAAVIKNSQPEEEKEKAQCMEAATSELERYFKKEYFGQMQVVGQFNLGFIIGKMDQDLFIIDQHAADEKYNFEQLSHSTILNLQPLLMPLRLELSPEEEIVASMHMQTIRKSGFRLIEDIHAPPGRRFMLKAVPFSKSIVFGAEDVKELISILADGQGELGVRCSYKLDTPDSICPSSVRAMLASRACRTSVMIGDPLTKIEMRKILRNLVDLNSPWNCPHGRPTMRHLVDLTAIHPRS